MWTALLILGLVNLALAGVLYALFRRLTREGVLLRDMRNDMDQTAGSETPSQEETTGSAEE